jgi:hypothetical protein
MTKEEKITFVNQLCMTLALDIGQEIDDGNIPGAWNGVELRCYIADKMEEAASRTEIRKDPNGKRARDYRNTIAVTTL